MEKKNILITGGAGFIGSHVARLFANDSNYNVIVFDALTYAGNFMNIKRDIETHDNYHFVKGDITNGTDVAQVFMKYNITDVVHLAAESHVDRSIKDPTNFVVTNVLGTVNLLNAALEYWTDNLNNHRFYHVSTDEVYGSLDNDKDNKFKETNRYEPHSPYSASKASSDHFVRAYHDTYGLNTVISNCSNNYGPNQFPEKLIPLTINNILNNKEVPVYGTGQNIRDWLYVEDHANAIKTIFEKGKTGETYNIGGNCELTNLEIIDKIMKETARHMHARYRGYDVEVTCEKLYEVYKNKIKFVEDRKGHDKRYAIDSTKLKTELGWTPKENIDTGIEKTVTWYILNKEWLSDIETGKYLKVYN